MQVNISKLEITFRAIGQENDSVNALTLCPDLSGPLIRIGRISLNDKNEARNDGKDTSNFRPLYHSRGNGNPGIRCKDRIPAPRPTVYPLGRGGYTSGGDDKGRIFTHNFALPFKSQG
jgi:hypothetical protein